MASSADESYSSKRIKLSPPEDQDSGNKAQSLSSAEETAETQQPNIEPSNLVESKKEKAERSSATDAESVGSRTEAPPLPDEAPPLPDEASPAAQEEEDDGWAPVWEPSAQAFYFYNRFTGASQWTNPRVPESTIPPAPGTSVKSASNTLSNPPPPIREALPAGGYNPAIHGDYDPNAWYAQPITSGEPEPSTGASADPNSQYAATAAFNRFTGRFQNPDLNPENFNDENKSKRQMNAFFDVDAAANSHDGRSLKAERSGKKLTKTELKQFKEKRKAKKEEKRRAWLRD